MKTHGFSSCSVLLALALATFIPGIAKGEDPGEMTVPDTSKAFHAGSGYIEITGAGDLLKERASLTFWVKLNRATPEVAERSGIHHISTHGGISHYPWTDGLAYFNTFRDSRVNGIELAGDIDREQWHLVTITSEPGENGWKLYQNTELVHQAPGTARIHTGTRFVLAASERADRLLDGYLHDVRLYDRVLTPAEIADLLQGTHVVDGLVAHWPLDGVGNKVARDEAGDRAGRLVDQQTMEQEREFDELRRQITACSNWDNERLANEVHRPEALILEGDRTPVDIVWRRTHALLEHLQDMEGTPDLTSLAAKLEGLRAGVDAVQKQSSPDEEVLRRLFSDITGIRREIAFANPLLDFDEILFIKRHRAIYEHMCDQYYGIAARPGGGLYVLENAFDYPRPRNILEDAVVENGRLQGQSLRGGRSVPGLRYDGSGRLREGGDPGGGAFLSPDLSFDGKRILFAYVECRGDNRHRYHWRPATDYWSEHWDKGRAFHVFMVNADGTGLKQLTDGPWNDMHPCWLPDGRIAFVSERRGGFLRCGRVCPVYTLFLMDEKGGGIRPLSYHETHEWLPSVDNNGMITYTRWDYVDRDSDIAHHIWLKYPDGRDPRAPHGNYPQVRESRPWMEMSIRAIPGSHRYLAVAAPHHGQHFGSLVLLDLRIEDDREMSQVRRVTPEVMLPESESAPGVPYRPRGRGGRGQVFGTPWPLSEDFYLAVYDPGEAHYGIYLVDAFGNRELIYRDPEIGCSDPIPFRPRATPPVIPDQTRYADREDDQPQTGTVTVMNVYHSLLPWPEETKLKELRMIQVFPKTTPGPDDPHVGIAEREDQSLPRGVVGVVPIEEDGSAHFEMPAGVPFYFQVLDENGMAVQTMRSITYVHPGETLSCVGCHEPKHVAPAPPADVPLALTRPPAKPQPEVEGSYPVTFPRLVQPVLDANCVSCHEQNRGEGAPGLRGDHFGRHGHSEAFRSLAPYAWGKFGGNFSGIQRNKTSYSIPGDVGAHASRLLPILQSGHHGVELDTEELRRITLWLDANSVFYGDYHEPAKQARGEVVIPRLE